MNLKGVLEGILFVVGDDGATIKELTEILEVSDDTLKELILELKSDLEKNDRGIRLSILGDALKLTTKKEHKEYYQKLLSNETSNTLSNSAIETLAIIAYNEPITRVEVDEIRGVQTAPLIRKLVAKGLIKEAGRSEIIGRPILYKTTSEFLDYFGLATIEDLPKMQEFIEDNTEESDTDLYHSKYKEIDEEVL